MDLQFLQFARARTSCLYGIVTTSKDKIHPRSITFATQTRQRSVKHRPLRITEKSADEDKEAGKRQASAM